MTFDLNRFTATLTLATLALALLSCQGTRAAESARVYFGTYTRGLSKGIYLARFDLETGRLDALELAAELANPSFLALHPTRPLVFAVGEMADFGGEKAGAVSALAVDRATGRLSLLNQQTSGGAHPCHVCVAPSGDHVLAANYTSGSLACYPIEADGSLGAMTCLVQHEGSSVNPRRQAGPHAHSINPDPAGRFFFAADLGLDKILVYRLESGRLVPNNPPSASLAPGSGPRHFTFHPTGRFAYVINELASTVTAFRYDAERGSLDSLQTISTLPEGFDGQSTTAEVQVHPSGNFLYGSNRGHDSIAIFRIHPETGKLTALGHASTEGKMPRNFAVDPTGRFLLAANQDTDNVVVMRIDQETGTLQSTGQHLKVGAPVCVKFAR